MGFRNGFLIVISYPDGKIKTTITLKCFEMNTKNLLLFGIVSLALATIIKTVINRMEIFDDEEEDHELDGHEEEYGFPLFI